VIYSPERVTTVKYRAPGSDKWEDKPWDWALDRIAQKIKETRDKSFITKDKDGATVNRLESIAYLGGAQHTNEEVYFWVKAARALGIVYLEHQARI
jgi:formate dehydrogenase major subunit